MTEKDPLDDLRVEIDALDGEIVALLARRMATAHRIAAVKLERGIPVRIPERISKVIERNGALGATHGLDAAYVRAVYTIVIEETCKVEEHLLASAAGATPR